MRKYIATVLALILSASACQTLAAEKPAVSDAVKPVERPAQRPAERAALIVTIGEREDNLDWNIAGNLSGTNPNVLSELKWEDLRILQIKAAGRGTIKKVFYLRGALGFGFIYDGTNQDSDYACDDRKCEYSRSNNRADTGSVWDFSMGGGFKNSFAVKGAAIDVIPLIGWSQHNQNLKITDGYQTIPAAGAFGGLNSSYKARWRGPWAGLDAAYGRRNFKLTGTLEYHVVRYYAEADWNLRTDFAHPKSFEHSANGTGFVAAMGGDYHLGRNWSVAAVADYTKFRTSHGTDRVFFSNGVIIDTRLNRVNWRSHSFNVGFKRSF